MSRGIYVFNLLTISTLIDPLPVCLRASDYLDSLHRAGKLNRWIDTHNRCWFLSVELAWKLYFASVNIYCQLAWWRPAGHCPLSSSWAAADRDVECRSEWVEIYHLPLYNHVDKAWWCPQDNTILLVLNVKGKCQVTLSRIHHSCRVTLIEGYPPQITFLRLLCQKDSRVHWKCHLRGL